MNHEYEKLFCGSADVAVQSSHIKSEGLDSHGDPVHSADPFSVARDGKLNDLQRDSTEGI